jgi:16S rRNA C967 or C1407 C5-methylase (RsmB/RsmF family)
MDIVCLTVLEVFLSVMSLVPQQPNERVLDVCTASGGKASYIGE